MAGRSTATSLWCPAAAPPESLDDGGSRLLLSAAGLAGVAILAEPDWDDIRLFAAVAAAGSLSGAATALALSQPAVGRRLRRLEATLGGELFQRLPNRLALTPLGRELLAHAQGMAEVAAGFARRAWRHRATERRPVRITATGSVSLFLARHMQDLAAATAASGAEITLLSTRERLSLARREAEIALRMRRLPAEGDLVGRRLGRIAFSVYGPAGCAAGDGRWEGLTLVGLPATERRPSQAAWLDAQAAARGATVLWRASELVLRHRAVLDGRGLTLLPCFLGDGEPRLARLLPPPLELAEDVHLLLHRDLAAVPAVAAVKAALVRLFRREARRLAGEPAAA